MSGLSGCFSEVKDPRGPNCVYRLGDMLVLMVAASLCGAVSASDMALFAALRKPVLNRLVPYQRAPSHDTFSRLLRLLDPHAFAKAFAVFAEAFAKALAAQGITPQATVVALDGKALRRAYERGLAHHPPLVVSAFAAEAKLCLAAQAVGEDNEIETALKVVELLDVAGKIVTADALHCHHRMAEAVCAKKGDYVLALKDNRHQWFAEAIRHFKPGMDKPQTDRKRKSSAKQLAHAHDRYEWRKAEVIAAEKPLTQGHTTFIRITSQRNREEPCVRYFMASRLFSAKQALAIVRSHWQIENNLHWVLDVHLAEDTIRARKDNAPANIAMIKRLARNILQTADQTKVPISHRLRKCQWDDNYLIHALSHMR
jgi:predicted transposase YbfD/YdcC